MGGAWRESRADNRERYGRDDGRDLEGDLQRTRERKRHRTSAVRGAPVVHPRRAVTDEAAQCPFVANLGVFLLERLDVEPALRGGVDLGAAWAVVSRTSSLEVETAIISSGDPAQMSA